MPMPSLVLSVVLIVAAGVIAWRVLGDARTQKAPQLKARIDGLATRPRMPNRRAADRAPAPSARAPAPVSDDANNRRAQRRRTLLRGRLCDEDGAGVDCVIQNLSASGAAVRAEGALPGGGQLSLIDPSNGFGYTAEVRWRFGARMGLKFLAAFDLRNPQQPQAVILARELAALRAAA